jgi:large subunit ribosomal protein L18
MKNLNKNRVFRFNRRTRGLTNYKQRLGLLKSELTRAVVRQSNNNMLVQLVDYADDGDIILTSAKSHELKKLGYTLNTGNTVAAYLTGILAGKRLLASKTGTSEVIIDMGLQKSFYGGRIYAAIKGLKDSGVDVRVSDVVFPVEERLSGAHLKQDGAEKLVAKVKATLEGM